MATPITDSLVPFTWFLVPVFIAALALALLLLFAFQTSRTAKWFTFWLDSRGIRRPEGRLREFIAHRARQRAARPAKAAEAPAAGGEIRGFLKSRARRRLEEKVGAEPKKTVAERLDALSARPAEAPLAPSLPEETLRKLEARARVAPPGGAGAGTASLRPAGSQALQASRQITESMVRALEEQVRQGLLAPQTFEELKARLVPRQPQA